MIDKYTYGNTPAAVNLAKILEERDNPHWRMLASRQISAFAAFLHELDDACLSFTKKRYLALLHHNEVKRNINKDWQDVDPIVKTHTLCVIKTRYRWMLKVWKYSEDVNKTNRHVMCLGVRLHPMWKAISNSASLFVV